MSDSPSSYAWPQDSLASALSIRGRRQSTDWRRPSSRPPADHRPRPASPQPRTTPSPRPAGHHGRRGASADRWPSSGPLDESWVRARAAGPDPARVPRTRTLQPPEPAVLHRRDSTSRPRNVPRPNSAPKDLARAPQQADTTRPPKSLRDPSPGNGSLSTQGSARDSPGLLSCRRTPSRRSRRPCIAGELPCLHVPKLTP